MACWSEGERSRFPRLSGGVAIVFLCARSVVEFNRRTKGDKLCSKN